MTNENEVFDPMTARIREDFEEQLRREEYESVDKSDGTPSLEVMFAEIINRTDETKQLIIDQYETSQREDIPENIRNSLKHAITNTYMQMICY